MKTMLGLLLTLVGIAILVYGIGMALSQVVGMYEGAMNAPLEDRPGESAVPTNMVRFVLIGCLGIPFLVVGKVLLIMGWRARRRARLRR